MRVWMRPFGFQRAADGADAAVHHVAGRDDVHTGLGLHQRLLHQHLDRLVVEDVAGVVEQAVLAVRGERVERHVGHHAQLGEALLQFAHHRGTRPSGLVASRPSGVFSATRSPGTAPSPGCPASRSLGHREQPIQAAALHAGHAGHVLLLAAAVEHEHRQDQVAAGQRMLTHQIAGEGIAAQAPRAAGGIRAAGVCTGGSPGRFDAGNPVTTGTRPGVDCRGSLHHASDPWRAPLTSAKVVFE
jgi:hypothetical protein